MEAALAGVVGVLKPRRRIPKEVTIEMNKRLVGFVLMVLAAGCVSAKADTSMGYSDLFALGDFASYSTSTALSGAFIVDTSSANSSTCYSDTPATNGGVTLGLSPNPAPVGQAVTATGYAPGAASVTLSFSVFGVIVPSIAMTAGVSGTWTATLPAGLLAAYRGSSMTVTATARLTAGGTAVQSETLWVGSGPAPPPASGSSLNLWDEDSGAYGLASGSHSISNPGGNPLTAELTVTPDLFSSWFGNTIVGGLWFGVDFTTSGSAQYYPSSGTSIPELMGSWPLGAIVGPGCSVAQMGTFYQQGDSVTFHLNLWDQRAVIPNTVTVILNFVPGGAAANQPGILNVVDDLGKIKPVSDAGLALFGTHHASPWEWTKAAGSALWSLKDLISDETARAALRAALTKINVNVTDGVLTDAATVLYVWDIGKSLAPYAMYYAQTKGHSIDCSFQAVRGSATGTSSALSAYASSPLPKTSAAPAQTSVTWQATPSATDWLVSYSVTNQGTNPVWSFSVFYEPSAGAPTTILDPTGWSHTVDSDAGTVTWYTQGPSGWVTGDYGTAAIQPGNFISGFGMSNTAPPDYSVCSCTDTAYGSCLAQIAAPAPAQGISAAKMRMANDQVVLSDKIVTAVFPDGSYYVEDPLRSCGIRVACGTQPKVGDKVRIVGTLGVVGGEAQVTASTCLTVGSGTVQPLGIPSRFLSGRTIGIQPATTSAKSLNNTGLLIRTLGKVTQIGTEYLYLDDGSRLKDGTLTGSDANIGVRVICDPSGHSSGDNLVITGISSCFQTPAGDIAPRILKT